MTTLDDVTIPEDTQETGIVSYEDKQRVYDEEFDKNSKLFIKIIQDQTVEKHGVKPGNWYAEGIEGIPDKFFGLVVGHSPFRTYSIYNQSNKTSLVKCISLDWGYWNT